MNNVWSDYFARYSDNRQHFGIDMRYANGNGILGYPIFASGNGRVIHISNHGGGSAGWFVAIRYNNGLVARYVHLDGDPTRAPVNLVRGQDVFPWTRIGTAGNSGSSGNGHLHFDVHALAQNIYCGDEIRTRNAFLNPVRFFPAGTFDGSWVRYFNVNH
jgi:murein DD-endopeptidase MepM/ murein hydrolase activator NlpD